MKKRNENFFTNNLLLKIIGLLLAILLWLLISNIQDPIIERNLLVAPSYDQSWLEENGYVAISMPTTVSIPYKVRRSNAQKVSASDFTVTVDMQEYLGGQVNIAPETTKVPLVIKKNPSAYYIEEWDYPKDQGQYVEVVIDIVHTGNYLVQFNTTGELSGSLQAGELIASPVRVKVTGPNSEFGSLASVKATVDLSQITEENNSIEAELHMYDGADRILNNKNLEMSTDTVLVTVGLTQAKEVGISLSHYNGEPAAGYGCITVSYEPKEITVVSGSKSALANLTSITIPRSALDISGATETKVIQVNLEDGYLPSDISVAEGESPIVEIVYEIEKLEERTFQVLTDTFEFIGTDDRYEYEIVSPTTEIVLRSFKEYLDNVVEEGIYLSGTINVSGMEPDGFTRLIPVTVSIQQEYKVVSDVTVEVMIREKTGSAAESTAKEDITEENTTEENTQEESTEENTAAEKSTAAEENTIIEKTDAGETADVSEDSGTEEKRSGSLSE